MMEVWFFALYSKGSLVYRNGSVVYRNRSVVYRNGSVVYRNRSIVYKYESMVTWKSGIIKKGWYTNGRVVLYKNEIWL